MDENRADTPEQVVKFAPKERPRSYGTPAEEPGQAIIAKIQKADDLSNENCDRATALAQRLSMQFRAAEDRINRLEGGRTSETGRSAPQDDFRRSRKLVCVGFSDARQRISLDARSARYRRLAKECLDIARTFSKGARRTVLLQMAQVWQRLADQYADSSMPRRAPPCDGSGRLRYAKRGTGPAYNR